MKKIIYTIVISLLCLNVVNAESITVKLAACVDGDTIKVLINNKEKTVRFLAVDTPESVHPTKPVEYYGKEASKFTCQKVTNAKKLVLEYDSNSDKTDKYGRVLAWIFTDDELLQDELIKGGYAEVAYLYGNYKYTDLLKDHQAVAEAAKLGIWNDEARKAFKPSSNSVSKSNNNNSNNISKNDMIILAIVLVVTLLFGNNKKVKQALKLYKKIK